MSKNEMKARITSLERALDFILMNNIRMLKIIGYTNGQIREKVNNHLRKPKKE